MSPRATFLAILFRRVWPDNVANLHCTLSLLRIRPERPCLRAAEQRDELAALHSITSSASDSSVDGTSMPSTLAVCTLMTNSNLVGCMIGRSDGFLPLRTRPT